MTRKLLLALSGCLTLVALGTMAPSAFANHLECTGLSPGIYPPSNPVPAAKGTFDLANTPAFGQGVSNTVDGFTGSAVLCDNGSGNYVDGTITTPNRGEQIHCASPNFATCPSIDGGGTPIPDGAYYGSAQTDAICKEVSLLCLFGTLQFHGVPTTVNVNYNDPNCTSKALVCATATATPLVGVTCTSSTIITRGTRAFVGPSVPGSATSGSAMVVQAGGTITSQYKLKIFQPNCTVFGIPGANPTYFTAIKNLVLCDYAGSPGSTSCPTVANSLWQQKNGRKGTHIYRLHTNNTGMTNQRAVAFITWT